MRVLSDMASLLTAPSDQGAMSSSNASVWRTSSTRGRLPFGLFALVACLFTASTPSAEAMTAQLAGGELRLAASPGEVVDLTARPGAPGEYAIDPGPGIAAIVAPAGCSTALGELACPVVLVSRLVLDLADGDDHVTIKGKIPATAHGGGGADAIRGGDGADTLFGDGGDDTLDGSAGNDGLDGGSGIDTLLGGADADRLDGGGDHDVTDGEAGDDTVAGGDGDDELLGGPGADAVRGDAGADTIDGGTDADAIDGGEGDDTILGSAGDDTIAPGDGDDSVDGGDGDDAVLASTGADVIAGGRGTDRIAGGPGTDTLTGDEGADQLDGGDDDDLLKLVADGDIATGGSGTDVVDYRASTQGLTIDLTLGRTVASVATDQFGDTPETVFGTDFADAISATDHAGARILAGAGDDVLVGGRSQDLLDGGAGWDTVDYSGRIEGVTISATGDPISGAPGENDTVTSENEVLLGGSGADLIHGGDGASDLRGGDGDDRIEDVDDSGPDRITCGTGKDNVLADRVDAVAADCERWENGSELLRTDVPIAAFVRSSRVQVNRAGRARVSVACSESALRGCRATVMVELRTGKRSWRRSGSRSFLLVPGRRRSAVVFLQRGFKQLTRTSARRRPRARVTVTVRDGLDRTATTVRIVPLLLPAAKAR